MSMAPTGVIGIPFQELFFPDHQGFHQFFPQSPILIRADMGWCLVPSYIISVFRSSSGCGLRHLPNGVVVSAVYRDRAIVGNALDAKQADPAQLLADGPAAVSLPHLSGRLSEVSCPDRVSALIRYKGAAKSSCDEDRVCRAQALDLAVTVPEVNEFHPVLLD